MRQASSLLAETPGGAAAGSRILVVEDEALVALMMEDLLFSLGCQVAGLASSVAEALEFLERRGQELDGAILDVNLGGESCYPIADELARRAIPFAFATGYGAHAIEPRFAERPQLAKPFELVALKSLLQQAFALRA